MTDHDFPRRRAITSNFRCGVPRNLSLAHDATGLLFLRSDSGTDPVNHLWHLGLGPGDSGERKIADARELMGDADEHLPDAERARRERLREGSSGITSFSTDQKHSKVCFALSGSLWVHDFGSGTNYRRIAAGVTTPVLDPTGRQIAFTKAGSLFVISADDDPSERAIALCQSTAESETWGSAEFIAAEEMGRYSGFWWAPDGERLLVARVDETPVDKWWISDPANPEQQPRSARYPAAGTSNADVRLFVVGVDRDRVEVTWDHDAYEYLTRVAWSTGYGPIVCVQSRDQQSVAVLSVDPESGRTTTVSVRGRNPSIDPPSPARSSAAETRATLHNAAPWIELVPGVPRQTSHGLLDVVADIESNTHRLKLLTGRQSFLTPPGLQVHAVQDADSGGVTFLASDDQTTQGLFRVDYSGQVQRLSQPGGWSVGRSVQNAFTTVRAEPETPTTSVSVTAGDLRLTLVNHSEDAGVSPRPEFIASGSAGLDTAVLWPSELPEGADGPLPIIMSPYGGPHAQRAIRAAAAFLTEQWIADHGYCVVVADGPGTPRTPRFEHSIHGDLATGALQGQIDALSSVVSKYGSRVDPDRVGIRGWSFGGYLAALAVLERPDLFHTAVAGAPVTDWALYDTHYTERYLGKPLDNPEAYQVSGLIDKAPKLTRPLLLVHGLSDDNVFAAHTLRLSSALLAAGREHTVLPLTGVTHMTSQEIVAENLLRLDFGFLDEALRRPGGQTEPRA